MKSSSWLALTCNSTGFQKCWFVNHSNYFAWFLMCFFCPVSERQAEPGGAEHPAPPAGHDGEFNHRLAVFPVNGANGKQKVPPPPHPFCPFSSRWFGCNIFSVTGALTLSVLIVLPRISGLYSQIIADYQAECEINPLTASHWCSAACWEHYRAPGSNCSAPRSQQRVQ